MPKPKSTPKPQKAVGNNATQEAKVLSREHERLDYLIGVIVSDLRVPLASIIGISETIASETVGPLNGKQKRFLGILNQVARNYLDKIHDFSFGKFRLKDEVDASLAASSQGESYDDQVFSGLNNVINLILHKRRTEAERTYLEELRKISAISEFVEAIKSELDWQNLSESQRRKAFSKIAVDFNIALSYPSADTDVSLVSKISGPPNGLLYAARLNRKETAPKFIERVYGGAGWLTGEFTRADLRKLDPAAAMGLANWERAHGRASLNLPTLKERNDRRISETPAPSKSEAVRAYDRERALRRKRPATTN